MANQQQGTGKRDEDQRTGGKPTGGQKPEENAGSRAGGSGTSGGTSGGQGKSGSDKDR